MKKISEVEISNISFNYFTLTDDVTGELVMQVTISFDGNVPCKDAKSDSQVDRNSLTMSFAQLKAKLYSASPVIPSYRQAKMRSLDENDVKNLLTSAEKVVVVASRYEANEEIDGHIARYWGIRHEFQISYDDTITTALTKTPEQRKAEAKAAILAALK